MAKTRLHLVFGGELKSLKSTEFANPSEIDVLGIFPDYEAALDAWRGAAQRTVDSAMTRYFIADLTKLRALDAAGVKQQPDS